ncbi:hypothetical protein PGT21_010706 [Puccinia graminis f. sp. tritici]|uniref:Uncharacterized protein n=1 Tax=Puccinia graminis f. sp. tritici TaxID=56615 RepID=A0A5B0QDT2_PUCGR|nr:hypothetical protein PGT21_010223 [Puccinia graminis f. sp. tritici]KAA1076538.1 hypothetical protein PGT21_010706 [Puccinia graminis f. sp. tritici]KAA1111252.1 hypothetical protein PGTUg99_002124 [Puccinia graminis f. sp. tritici]KAA1121975.1 hypothetical protein PGTUg99_012385 [Puccinia graminis f. sp. tritici]
MHNKHLGYVALLCAPLANVVFSVGLLCNYCNLRNLHLTPTITEAPCGELRGIINSCKETVEVNRFVCRTKTCGMAVLNSHNVCGNPDQTEQHVILPQYYKPLNCDQCGTGGSLHWTGVTASYGCGTFRHQSACNNPNYCSANVMVRQYKCEAVGRDGLCPRAALVPIGSCDHEVQRKKHTPATYYYTP